jgi:Eco57I restriction endonuclease.
MNVIEIKNKFDVLLKQLSVERSFDVAEKISTELVGLLSIKANDRFLVNIPRVDAELTRFQLAPGFARQAAAYELPHEEGKPFDLKLFWIKKASKTNLSWLIGLTPNFEDAPSNDYKNIGIDFVVPEACDSVTVLLSNRFKVRALELKDHITPTQLEIFAQWAKLAEVEISDQNELKNNLHVKLWESFNFEPINRKFYLALVEHFSILVHHLEKDLGPKPAVMFTTRLLGRLLFIWFLKKKNLVNKNVDYFLVPDPEKQSEYYKKQLEKLFFDVLNRDELERSNGDKLTPYLNGGLFDKSTTDFYGDPKLTFPRGYFNQLFTTLNKYNFTVDESSPEFQHVAIDPEMLGRIFESLLAEQIDENTGNSKKKATGAFYTPREIVSYMCEQSLIEYLKTKIPDAPDRDRRIDELVRMPEAIFRDQDQNKRRDWKPYRESIIKALEGTKTESALTVLDPAVGSGAFPMGMLHLLVKVYSRLDPKFEKDISGLKRDILSRSLYGVDIEQTAIEITRLRAWLSIIVDIPEDEKVQPLPNLEFKFVCANTLIPLDNSAQATFNTDHDLKDKLITIRDDYFRTSSKTKKEKLQKDYLKLTQKASLFDNKKTQQLRSYKPFDISSSSDFYDPGLMHGVKAFDVVIGNPPYVGEKGNKAIFRMVKNSFLGQRFYRGKMDYFYFFFHAGIDLLKDSGLLSFITTNYYITASGGLTRRKDLKNRTTILNLLNFNKLKIFKSALGQKNIITILRKGKYSQKANCIYTHQTGFANSDMLSEILEREDKNTAYFECDQENLYYGPNLFIKGDDNNIAQINFGKAMLSKLDDFFNISQGVVEAPDKISKKISERSSTFIKGDGVFVINQQELNDLNLTDREKVVIKKYLNASDVSRYNIKFKNEFLIFSDKINRKLISGESYPNLKKHLDKFKPIITSSNAPYGLHRDRSSKVNIFEQPKLICVGMFARPEFTYDDEHYYVGFSFSVVWSKNSDYSLKYLLGLLNSKVGEKWFNQNGKKRGVGVDIGVGVFREFPVPILDELISELALKVESIVDQILTLKKQNKDADTKNLESQIDQLVYKLYDLTLEEIEIVENSGKK